MECESFHEKRSGKSLSRSEAPKKGRSHESRYSEYTIFVDTRENVYRATCNMVYYKKPPPMYKASGGATGCSDAGSSPGHTCSWSSTLGVRKSTLSFHYVPFARSYARFRPFGLDRRSRRGSSPPVPILLDHSYYLTSSCFLPSDSFLGDDDTNNIIYEFAREELGHLARSMDVLFASMDALSPTEGASDSEVIGVDDEDELLPLEPERKNEAGDSTSSKKFKVAKTPLHSIGDLGIPSNA
uniref:Uncharacterized protein n=1 Tax=Cannabis sativa TaxID=3483 RepID=A0A803PT39_CANSA